MKRYEPTAADDTGLCMVEDKEGEWVEYDEVVKLVAKYQSIIADLGAAIIGRQNGQ
jgi:hypothetical protein